MDPPIISEQLDIIGALIQHEPGERATVGQGERGANGPRALAGAERAQESD
jgi:hypothetical protein